MICRTVPSSRKIFKNDPFHKFHTHTQILPSNILTTGWKSFFIQYQIWVEEEVVVVEHLWGWGDGVCWTKTIFFRGDQIQNFTKNKKTRKQTITTKNKKKELNRSVLKKCLRMRTSVASSVRFRDFSSLSVCLTWTGKEVSYAYAVEQFVYNSLKKKAPIQLSYLLTCSTLFRSLQQRISAVELWRYC